LYPPLLILKVSSFAQLN
ncbi:hypothetical protein SCA6_017884, partial [Theobroma cacao]